MSQNTTRATVTFADGTSASFPADVAASITGKDGWGLPVAVSDDGWKYYPTECCGAAVSVFSDDGTTYCKGCYGEQSSLLGGVPDAITVPVTGRKVG